jgi:hypothetical protein
MPTIRTEPVTAVEAKSHYAEILYRYGDPEAAYTQIMDLTRAGRERREYPEVSYSVNLDHVDRAGRKHRRGASTKMRGSRTLSSAFVAMTVCVNTEMGGSEVQRLLALNL